MKSTFHLIVLISKELTFNFPVSKPLDLYQKYIIFLKTEVYTANTSPGWSYGNIQLPCI